MDSSLLLELINTHGYWVIALVIGLESAGVPLPGEAMLVAASVYAGTTGNLDITWVIAAAATGAVVGDNIGYWIGRELGHRFLRRFGPRIGLSLDRQLLGRHLFHRHGGKVVAFGRFFALLRVLAALLAGANGMAWWRFFLFNIMGGVGWATVFGFGGYLLGHEAERVLGPFAIIAIAIAAVLFILGAITVHRHERRLIENAKREMAEEEP